MTQIDGLLPINPESILPVELVQTGSQFDSGLPEPGIGLCLSGGGFRAMLFQVNSKANWSNRFAPLRTNHLLILTN
jgi:hypothetical protein